MRHTTSLRGARRPSGRPPSSASRNESCGAQNLARHPKLFNVRNQSPAWLKPKFPPAAQARTSYSPISRLTAGQPHGSAGRASLRTGVSWAFASQEMSELLGVFLAELHCLRLVADGCCN